MSMLTKRLTVFVLVSIQTLLILWFARRGIYADQWDLVPILGRFLSGQEWFSLANEIHGGHYHTAAYLIMLPLAKLSGWSLFAEAVVIVVLSLMSFYLLYVSFLRPMMNDSSRLSALLVILITALFFSASHLGNALWSWQIAVYLCIFYFLLCLSLLSKQKFRAINFFTAILAAVVASYSFACGLAIWPIGVLMIWANFTLSTRVRLFYVVGWMLAGVIVVYQYLANSQGSSGALQLHAISDYFVFQLYYLGTPIAYFSRDLTLLVSLVGLFSSFYFALKLSIGSRAQSRQNIVAIIVMILFALVCGGLIAIGRLPFGIDQARSFRYIIFAQFFWIGLLLLIFEYYRQRRQIALSQVSSKGIEIAIGVFLIVVVFNSQKIGRSAIENAVEYDKLFFKLESESTMDLENVRSVANYPSLETLQSHIATLKKHKLSIYGEELPVTK